MTDVGIRLAALAIFALVGALAIPQLRSVAAWALLALAVVVLRPSGVGGPTTVAFISGVSMQPAMHTGDLAVLLRDGDYSIGDVIAYHPSQAPEGLIIHRIVGGDAASGFVVRGDNRTTDDYDRPTTDEIVGRALVVLPSVGWFFAGLRIPVLLGFVVALIAMWFAWDYLFETKKEEGLT